MDTYVVMVIDDDHDAWEATYTQEQKQAVYDADGRFAALLAERGGRVVGGQELEHPRRSRVLRRGGDGGGAVSTEGPYAETAEQVAGFYVVECDDLEALTDACAAMLPAHLALEIRPVPSR